MVGRRDPIARIFEGLIHALARYGVNRTSMTDVSTETGISRGTLYRYFSTKEELLDGLADYLVDDLRQQLARSVTARPQPDDRIEVILQELRMFSERRPSFEQLVHLEPLFAINWYRTKFDELLATVTELIAPAVGGDDGPHREIDVLARLLLRLTLSFQLLPPAGGDRTVAQMAGVLEAYAKSLHPSRPAASVAGRDDRTG